MKTDLLGHKVRKTENLGHLNQGILSEREQYGKNMFILIIELKKLHLEELTPLRNH